MSTNIYNLLHPVRQGWNKMARGGKDMFGTVVKHGLMDKTVTVSKLTLSNLSMIQVRISHYSYNYKVQTWFHRGRNMQCHDEENYMKTGDKVVIRACRKISNLKYYYVRNIVKPIGRQNVTGMPSSVDEAEALEYNAKLREQVPKIYF